MNLKELDSFKLSDAISFHNELNPKLFKGNKLSPLVREQLLTIADDFLQELGINELDVRDITISGSNAAYSYTPHSDLDLHILVNMADLPQSDVYKELFNAKKSIYNDTHDIKIHNIPVELYIQDSAEPVKSLGEYSVKNNKWINIPTKRRANFDQTATKAKYEKLLELVNTALKTKDHDKLSKILKKIKQYRQAGLDKGGEFGPENLAFKALRSQGYITKLYDLRDKLHSERLSIEGMYAQEDYHPNAKPRGPEFKPTMPAGTVKVDVSDVYDWYKLGQHISNLKGLGHHDFGKGPPSTIMAFGSEPEEHKYIKDLEKTGLSTTDIDPLDKNQPKGMKRQKTDPTYNVNEAFDQPYKLKWEKGDHGDVDAYAKMDDGNYLSIMFNKGYSQGTKEEAWSVEFYRNNSQEVTGEGDAQRVFATVLSAIQTFIKKYKPNRIIFSASKEVEPGQNAQSRARLYDSLVQRYAKAWGFRAFRADTGNKVIYELDRIKKDVAEGATVTRIDSKPITDFSSGLKAYKHTDDWSQSGVDTGDDSYWKNKNLKTNTTKGLFAGDPHRTALYATGNAHETRYVEFTQNGQPIVYFDKKDLPAIRGRKTYLTVFDAGNFKKLPTGEWFSENPGKPIKQTPIGDPFKYIADQGWIVRVTDDLDKVFNQVQKMHKAGKIDHYGAEGMNESKSGVAEARTNPEQNPKPESGFKELASIAKTISDPENWAISMTSEPKLGINPQVGISEDTPKGIYFYPLNYALDKTRYGKLPWGNDYPYIQLFQYDRSREMTKQTKVDPAKLKQALLQYCSEEVIQSAIDEPEYDGTPYWFIYDCLSRLGQNDETNVVRWNKVLRDLGFTSVYDDGAGWIAYNEPTQGVVLDPRVIKQHKTITNKKQSGVVTPAVIERAIFETMDMELASNRAWQAYDPDGSKLRQAAKEYAKKPEFKQYYGKPGSEEIFNKAEGWGRYGARQLSDIAYEWFKAQKAQSKVNEASGYIPSEKEKNDPRFKTALTVDVKPDSIKKNAKAFSWLTNRAGIPPTAKPSGKI